MSITGEDEMFSNVGVASATASGNWWMPLATEGVKALGSAAGSGPAAPSRSDSGGLFQFDNSGWVVNTGSGSASNSPASNQLLYLALAAGVGLLIWKMANKKR